MKRREFIKAGLAALPLFNIGCAGFGQGGRAGAGRKLLWDGRRVTNNVDANKFLTATYRPGWEVFDHA